MRALNFILQHRCLSLLSAGLTCMGAMLHISLSSSKFDMYLSLGWHFFLRLGKKRKSKKRSLFFLCIFYELKWAYNLGTACSQSVIKQGSLATTARVDRDYLMNTWTQSPGLQHMDACTLSFGKYFSPVCFNSTDFIKSLCLCAHFVRDSVTLYLCGPSLVLIIHQTHVSVIWLHASGCNSSSCVSVIHVHLWNTAYTS